MIALQDETIPEAVTDTVIKRVFQVARLLATVKPADTTREMTENYLENEQSDEMRYRVTDRTTHTK